MKKKGIILAGGNGTRLFPLTNVISKQLLPVYDKPMIYYPLATLMQAGIREVMVIATKEDMNRYRKLLGDGSFLGMDIYYTIQDNPGGIAESFIITEDFIGKDHVTLILGDNIFYGKRLKDVLNAEKTTEIGAEVFAVEVDEPEKYGVIRKDEQGKIMELIEKPLNPPSNLAVTGLYRYDNNVVNIAKSLKPSARGELEITDVNNIYLKENLLNVTIFDEAVRWFDTGGFDSLLEAGAFVKYTQEETGSLIGAIEYIAFENGWISKEQFEDLILRYKKSGYGNRLHLQITI